jgi:quercetin dioxygenase-like cupin family protein
MAQARRIVTGHDGGGKAVILSDGPASQTLFDAASKIEFFEIWNTNASPAPIHATESEPTARPIKIPPRKAGTIIRVVDFHPGGLRSGRESEANLAATSFAAMGAATSSTWKPGVPHPMMHRTESIDYGIVIEGEIYLILDESETLIKPGNVVIQRGTNHAWDNRGSTPCRMIFVLIDGVFAPELAASLAEFEAGAGSNG